MSFLCFRVNTLPDLTLHKYQSLSDTGVQGILTRHNNFLRQWHGICLSSDTSLHLLAYFNPSATEGNRLELYILLQGNRENLTMIKPLFFNTALNDFYQFDECEIPNAIFTSGATLIKKEQRAEIYHELSNSTKYVHYVPGWEVNDSGRLYDLYRSLATVCLSYEDKHPTAYRIDLYPVDITQSTRVAVNDIIKSLNMNLG